MRVLLPGWVGRQRRRQAGRQAGCREPPTEEGWNAGRRQPSRAILLTDQSPQSPTPHQPTNQSHVLTRFDRELVFPLPNLSARGDILRIHTQKWAEPPPPQLLEELSSLAVGYCGADLKVSASGVVGLEASCCTAGLHWQGARAAGG